MEAVSWAGRGGTAWGAQIFAAILGVKDTRIKEALGVAVIIKL